MARAFPGLTTSTDRITTAITSSDTNLSLSIWFYRTGGGANSLGRLISKAAAVSEEVAVYIASSNAFTFEVGAATANGRWTFPWIAAYDNAWQHVVITYAKATPTVAPNIYFNGVLQTLTLGANPSGALKNEGLAWHIGNNSANARCFQGRLAEIAIWAKILTANDARALSQGYSPLFLVGSTRSYTPLSDPQGRINYRGGGSTVVNTTLAPHPKIYYPSFTQSFYDATVASLPTSNASLPLQSLPLSIGSATTRTTGLAHTGVISLPLTIASASTKAIDIVELPSLALQIEVGDISTASVDSARPGAVSLPLSISGATTRATSLVRPASVSLGLSIGAVSSRVQAKPSTANIGISIGVVGSLILARPTGIDLGLTFGGANAQGSTGLDSFYIDCGSAVDYVDTNARTWVADAYATGGSMATTPNATSGTPDSMLYQSVRIGSAFSYAFPIRNDTYNVTLHFVEPASWAGVGQRKFHIDAEGARVYTDFDISARAGGINIATTYTFTTVVSDGELNIAFTQGNNPALVSAIQIESVSVPLQAKPPNIPLPLEIGVLEAVTDATANVPPISLPLTVSSVSTNTTALVKSPSLALQIEVGDISLRQTARAISPSISLPLSVSPANTSRTAFVRPAAVQIPISVGSITALGQGAITPPPISLPLTISAIATVATAKALTPNRTLPLSIGGASTRVTAFVRPATVSLGLSVYGFSTKTTAFVLPSYILLPLIVSDVATSSISVIPISYGGMSNVTLRNRVVDIKTLEGRTGVVSLSGRTDIDDKGDVDVKSKVVW